MTPAGARNGWVCSNSKRVVGVELEKKTTAAHGFVLFAKRRGCAQERMQRAQETAVGRPRPADHARASPPLAAQPVEPTVVAHAREGVRRHGVAVCQAHLAQPGPGIQQGGVLRGDAGQPQPAAGVVGLGQRRLEVVHRARRLRREHRLVARRGRRGRAPNHRHVTKRLLRRDGPHRPLGTASCR